MPGKVNPSIPEMVNQVCFQVIGCDATITAAAEAGQLELNVMMPVIAWNALHACTILTQALVVLRSRTIDGIAADRERCRELLDRSTAIATALSPYIGYAATAEIAKESVRTGRPIRELVLARGLLDAGAARCDPRAGVDDAPGHTGRGTGRVMTRAAGRRAVLALARPRRCAAGRRVALVASCCARCATARQHGVAQERPRHGRLFPPEALGDLEGPDRDAWQMPDAVMDALGIADGSHVADIGAGGGWFTVRLARRVGPNGARVRAGRPEPDARGDPPARRPRGAPERAHGARRRRPIPRLPPESVEAVLIVDAYHEFSESAWRCSRGIARR